MSLIRRKTPEILYIRHVLKWLICVESKKHAGVITERASRAFLEHLKEKDAASVTIQSYRYDLAKFERETNGRQADVAAVGPLDLAEFRLPAELRAAAGHYQRVLAALSVFFDWAASQGYARTNQARDVKRVRQVKPAPKALERRAAGSRCKQ